MLLSMICFFQSTMIRSIGFLHAHLLVRKKQYCDSSPNLIYIDDATSHANGLLRCMKDKWMEKNARLAGWDEWELTSHHIT